jgi:hypothetical protein
MNNGQKHNFKVGDLVFHNEEVFTISQLTYINGWAAYFVKEVSYTVADIVCSVPPVPGEETSNF